LQDPVSNERLARGWTYDDIRRHDLPIVEKKTESIGTFCDAAICHLQRNSPNGLNPEGLGCFFRYPRSGGAGIYKKRDFLPALWVPYIGHGKIQVNVAHELPLSTWLNLAAPQEGSFVTAQRMCLAHTVPVLP
jgi:hypothetical protein